MQYRIHQEVIEKSITGAFFHIPSALLFWYFFAESSARNEIILWPFPLIVLIAFARIWIYFKKAKSLSMATHFHLQTSLFTLGALCWGIATAHTVFQIGLISELGLLITLVQVGYSTGVLQIVSPAMKHQFAYLFALCAPHLFVLVFYPQSEFDHLYLGFFGLFLVYLTLGGLKASANLKRSIRTEINLRYQAEKIQHVLDSVPGFVAIANEEGFWTDFSNSFRRFQTTPQIRQAMVDFLDSKARGVSVEIDWTEDRFGEAVRHCYLVSFEKIWDVTLSVIAVGVPIRALKEAQEQLTLQRSNAEYSARLATLGEMAGGIAHEINNPLAVIQIAASLITRMTRTSAGSIEVLPEIEKKSEKIVQTTQRISKIIQGLQSFSRQGDRDPFAPVNLEHAIENSLELCRERFKKSGVALDMDPVPTVMLKAREVQISQVLLNLLNNAFDAIHEESVEKLISLRFDVEPDFVTIRVQDSGHGIPEEIANRIFTPFFTTKEVGKGTGLGLSISKGIIEDHGGQLRYLRSEEKTTFEIRLPLLQSDKTSFDHHHLPHLEIQ